MKVFDHSSPLGVWWFIEKIFSKPIVVSLIYLAVPLFGVYLSLFEGCIYAFQRSGAVLVSLAIFCVFVNHFLSREISDATAFLQQTNHLTTLEKAIQAFSRSPRNAHLNNDQKLTSAISIMNLRKESEEKIPALKNVNSTIVIIEFLAGFIGTLLWGFGDIPFIK